MAERTIAGRYALLAALGRGGFGEVWRAQDATFGREVAIKLVDAVTISNTPQLGDIVARFRRESLAVGGLRHPNIVTVFDAGQDGSTLYLVMELVPGSSLAGILEDRRDGGVGPMPVADVLDIGAQTCAGLASAHAAGVVHRDIKPANLMIGSEGQLKIIDFGIARVIHDDLPRLTAPGSGVGTLAYVAPEQAQGLEVDGRADLYSLGCMLYELLAGERPFVAAVPAALLAQQFSQRPTPLRVRRPEVPGSLAALIEQLMEKEAADRPAAAGVVADRLTAIREGLASAQESAQAPGRLSSEAARPTVLAGAGAPDTEPYLPAGQYRKTVLAGEPGSYAQTVDSGAAIPAPRSAPVPAAQPQPAQSRPVQSPPDQSPPDQSRPAWWQPDGAARRPRRRVSWWAVAAASVVLAAAGVILAMRLTGSHGTFAVTAVAVAPASQPAPGRCNITVSVVGTIVTSGGAGTASYQWTRSDGTTSPVQTVTVASGQSSAQVHLNWSFRGRGTIHATATLRVLSPSVRASSTSFVYSCR